MNYCGIDLEKKSSHFHIVDGERKTVTAGRFENNMDAISKVFAKRDWLEIVVEASGKAFWMADRLMELGHELVVVRSKSRFWCHDQRRLCRLPSVVSLVAPPFGPFHVPGAMVPDEAHGSMAEGTFSSLPRSIASTPADVAGSGGQ